MVLMVKKGRDNENEIKIFYAYKARCISTSNVGAYYCMYKANTFIIIGRKLKTSAVIKIPNIH
jgi:hypothetical protein